MTLKRIFLGLLLFLAAAVGYYVYAFVTFASDIQQPHIVKDQSPDKPNKSEIPVWGGKERVNILLMGVDSRERSLDEMPRSDTMLVVSIDPASKTYSLFSVLRDTYVEIPGYGSSRINAALSHGGPSLAMQTISNFTGLPIDYYVITDFEGFKGLVDAVGGVEFEVEKDMYYRDPADKGKYDINLKKGLQHLDGEKALQYVRFRHDAMSDYTRTERQRKFLSALADKMKRGATVLQLPDILESMRPYVQTNLSSLDMVKLAALGLTLDGAGAEGHQLPQPGAFREANRGGSVLLPSVERVQTYVQDVLSKSAEQSPKTDTDSATQG
ncbi:LCP family protein [Brevibacillus humidisoli]|uniref:LCP family protein n=1 Tax=Brevibacillus humidisoli TaxID=2895522 RepID=UPI001E4A738A|nr:LCP family protein [Brevibacillus humidisoli]UFJ40920.1 LCP family protein [Brevibacillus humidisoli]